MVYTSYLSFPPQDVLLFQVFPLKGLYNRIKHTPFVSNVLTYFPFQILIL